MNTFYNIQYNLLLNVSYTKDTKVIAYVDYLTILFEAEQIGEAESFANIELQKIA